MVLECAICMEIKKIDDMIFLTCIHFLCSDCNSRMKKNECQVEVDTKEQLQALLTLPDGTIDFVLCDNFGPEALAEVHLIYTCMCLSLLM